MYPSIAKSAWEALSQSCFLQNMPGRLVQSWVYSVEMFQELPKTQEPDVLYYMLQCLHLMVLHGDSLNKAVKDNRGFIIWCQENLIIKK